MERTYRILPVSKNQESRIAAPPVPDIYRTILSIWMVCFICVSFAKSVERNTFCHLLLNRYNCSWHNDALPAAPLLPLYSVLQTVTQISNGRSWERNPCEEKGHFVSSKLCDAMWTNMTVMTVYSPETVIFNMNYSSRPKSCTEWLWRHGHLGFSSYKNSEWQRSYILGLVNWRNDLWYIIKTDRGRGRRRAQLSALISHTGKLAPSISSFWPPRCSSLLYARTLQSARESVLDQLKTISASGRAVIELLSLQCNTDGKWRSSF